MRPVQIMAQPAAHPFVCIKCGTGHDREHFVDLGVDSEMTIRQQDTGQELWTEGVVYLCNMCISGLFMDYFRNFWEFINSQRNGITHKQNKFGERIEKLNNRVLDLSRERDELRKELDSLKQVQTTVEEPPVSSAAELLEKIGIPVSEVINDGSGNSTPVDAESDSDATGTDSGSDGADQSTSGDDSAVESASTPEQTAFSFDFASASGGASQ